VFAPTLALAKKLFRSGADALVIEGSEAGGHIGPVSTSVLAQEFLPELAADHLVFVAGGIGRGVSIASYLGNGRKRRATRHAVCLRDRIHCPPGVQGRVLPRQCARCCGQRASRSAPAGDPVRALRNKGQEEFTAKQIEVAKLLDEGAIDMAAAQLQIEHFWAGALRRAVIEGDVERGSVMAGQSVGMVGEEEPVAVIMDELMRECEAALTRA